MKRPPLFLLVLCFFMCACLFFWPNPEEGKGAILSTAQAQALDLSSNDEAVGQGFPLRAELVAAPVFVDKLTGKEIRAEKINYNSDEKNSPLTLPASQVDFPVGTTQREFWSYSLPTTNGERLMKAPVGFSKNDREQFVLPWVSSISFKPLSGSYTLLKEADVKMAFPDEVGWSRVEAAEFGNANLVSPARSIDAMLATYETQFQPLEWLGLHESSDGYGLPEIPISGRCLLRIQHPICGEVFHWVDLSPGERVEIERVMSERPVFEGIVFDEEGNPIPRAFVYFMVQLNPEAPNLHVRPGDASGGRSALGSGDDWVYLLKKKTRTNGKGEFKLDVPPGVGFAIEVISPDRQAYAYQLVDPVIPGDIARLIEVELILQPQGGLEVQCLAPNGDQVSGVELAIRIGSDQWGRSYPLITSDSEELTLFPWLPPQPTTIGIFVVRNKLWESAGELAQIIEVDGTPDQVLTVYVKPVEQPKSSSESDNEIR